MTSVFIAAALMSAIVTIRMSSAWVPSIQPIHPLKSATIAVSVISHMKIGPVRRMHPDGAMGMPVENSRGFSPLRTRMSIGCASRGQRVNGGSV